MGAAYADAVPKTKEHPGRCGRGALLGTLLSSSPDNAQVCGLAKAVALHVVQAARGTGRCRRSWELRSAQVRSGSPVATPATKRPSHLRANLLVLLAGVIAITVIAKLTFWDHTGISVPYKKEIKISFQGVKGKLRIYADEDWPKVRQRLGAPDTVRASYLTESNTVLAAAGDWRQSLAHELSHLHDFQSGVTEEVMGQEVPECRRDPDSFIFEVRPGRWMVSRDERFLAYFCQRTEVLARYREREFFRVCGENAGGNFLIPGEPVCEIAPWFEHMTFGDALAAAGYPRS
jgi:hypothetical protein